MAVSHDRDVMERFIESLPKYLELLDGRRERRLRAVRVPVRVARVVRVQDGLHPARVGVVGRRRLGRAVRADRESISAVERVPLAARVVGGQAGVRQGRRLPRQPPAVDSLQHASLAVLLYGLDLEVLEDVDASASAQLSNHIFLANSNH